MTGFNGLLDFAIGMIALFLVASLMAMAFQEALAQTRDARAKTLREVITKLIERKDDVYTNEFFDNPLIKALNTRDDGNFIVSKSGPSYIPRDVFVNVVKELYLGSNAGMQAIEAAKKLGEPETEKDDGMPTPPPLNLIQKGMKQLALQAGESVEKFDKAIGDWFDSVMERVSGLYKRRTQLWVFCIGFAVAAGGNLDALTIGGYLARSPQTRIQVAGDLQKSITTATQPDDVYKKEVVEILNKANIPIGWGKEQVRPLLQSGALEICWLLFLKLLGFLITALSTLVGAAFWFDLLKRFVNIRAAGPLKRAESR